MKRNLGNLFTLILMLSFVPLSVVYTQSGSVEDLVYCTFMGGSGEDRISDVVLDSQGSIIICGGTFSEDFPVLNAVQSEYAGGSLAPGEPPHNMGDGFIAKFTPGYELLWSTYLGGSDLESALHIEVDDYDNVMVFGQTLSDDFPVTFPSTPSGRETGDPFIAYYSPEGELIGSRLYHPEWFNSIQHVDLDQEGNLVLVGDTSSSLMPCTDDAFQSTLSGDSDGYVWVVSSDLEEVVFSSYIGGSGTEFPGEICVTGDNSFLVSGSTSSVDFPVTEGCIRSEPLGEHDNFIAKISPSRELVACTYIGGSDVDHTFGLCEGPDNTIVSVGRTWSDDYPVSADALQDEYSGVEVDGFLTILGEEGTEVIYSTYYGRDSWDSLLQVNMDEKDRLVVTGFVLSGGFETVNAFQSEYKGSSDIVLMVWGDEIELITLLGSYSSEHPFEQILDEGTIYVVGQTESTSFPVSVDTYQGSHGGQKDGFIWVFDYDEYLAEDRSIQPQGVNLVKYTPYVVVLGAVAVWFIVIRRRFSS